MQTFRTRRLNFLFFLLVVFIPFGFSNFFFKPETGQLLILQSSIICVLIIVGFQIIYKQRKELKFPFTKIDTLLLAGICFLLIHSFISKGWSGFNLFLVYEIIGYVFVYIISKKVAASHINILIYALVFSGLTQSTYCILQWIGFLPSNHGEFLITGSFNNPGPYAGYLVSVLPFSLMAVWRLKQTKKQSSIQANTNVAPNHFSKRSKNQWYRFLPFIFIVLIIVQLFAIVLSNSRAAWLSVFISIIYLGYHLFQRIQSGEKLVSWLKRRFHLKIRKVFRGTVLIIVSIIIVFGLYNLNKDSANGRLFIWQITSEMIKDKPVWGFGTGGFKANYMEYQAEFFKQNVESSFSGLADNIIYPFNEFLRVISEFGVPGILFLFVLLYFVLLRKTEQNANNKLFNTVMVAKASFLAMFVFAFFSYPLEIVPIKLNNIICLALISFAANQTSSFKLFVLNKRIIKFFGTTMIVLAVFLFVNTTQIYRAQRNWKLAETSYKLKAYKNSLKYYKKAYPILKNDGEFLVHNGKALSMAGESKKSIETLKQALGFLSNSIIYTTLGDNYKRLGDFNSAKKSYQRASHMLPGRLYPKYLLTKLHLENGDTDKALNLAKEITAQKVKVESKAAEEIKNEMQAVIDSLSTDTANYKYSIHDQKK